MSFVYAGYRGDGMAFAPSGGGQPGAIIAVYLTGTTTYVPLFTDRTKVTGVNQATTPVTADNLGNYSYYCAPGLYDEVCNGKRLPVRIEPDSADLIPVGVDPCAFIGCDPTGTIDSAPAWRLAAAFACLFNLPLKPSPGTYLFNSLDGNQNFITLTRGIEMDGGGATMIIVGTAVPHWYHMFGTLDNANVDMSGLDVHDFIFDGNSANNPVNSTNANYHRNCIAAFAGSDIRVHHNTWKNWDGRNTVTLSGYVNGMGNVWVEDNLFDNMGGSYWHDTSVVYIVANNAECNGNVVNGVIVGPTTPSNCWTAFEVHGHNIVGHDNIVTNFASAGLLVSSLTGPVGPSSSYSWHDNVGYNVGTGVGIDPLLSMSELDIHDNTWFIGIDQWPTAAASPYPGSIHCGVAMAGTATSMSKVDIHHNRCTFLPFTTTPAIGDSFVWWVSAVRAPNTHSGVSIEHNRIFNCPGPMIYMPTVLSIANWDVNDNRCTNLGSGLQGANEQAGFFIGYQVWVTTRPVGVLDLRFNRNKFIDTQGSHTLSAPLLFGASIVRTDANISTTNGSSVLTYTSGFGVLTDSGSLVSGPGIPAGAFLSSPRTFQGGSSFNVIAWNMSVNAGAGAGTGSVTLATQPPTTQNVEVIDTNIRMADGGSVPLVISNSGEVVTVRGNMPSFSQPVGDTTAGSTITDTTTGITWVQSVSPFGSTWVNQSSLATTNLITLSTNPTNLLTADQSNMTNAGAGFWPGLTNCTTAQDLVHTIAGGPSCAMTATGSGPQQAQSGFIPVSPNLKYTATVKFLATTTVEQVRLYLQWFTSGNSLIATVGPVSANDNTSTPSTLTLSNVLAPSNAAKVKLLPYVAAGAANEVHCFSVVTIMVSATSMVIDPANMSTLDSMRIASGGTAAVSVNPNSGDGTGGIVLGDGAGHNTGIISVASGTPTATVVAPTWALTGDGHLWYNAGGGNTWALKV